MKTQLNSSDPSWKNQISIQKLQIKNQKYIEQNSKESTTKTPTRADQKTGRAARGKFVSGAKVLAAVPSMSQPKEFTRTDLKLAVPGRSFQQTLKYRDLSRNGESHLFLAQSCTNIIQFICCHCLVLIHVIVVQEREPSKANSVSARFASVSSWLALTLA